MNQAHARRTDPGTSHDAADAITPNLRSLQAKVAAYAKRKGPAGFTDAQMSDELEDSTSTLRTRRAELAARYIVLDSGHKRTHGESTRERIVWVHRDFVPDAPPIREPDVPISNEDKAEARNKAAQLVGFAKSFRNEGRGAVADAIEDAARLLERLAK